VTGATRPLVLTAAEVAEASGGRLRRGSASREIGSFTTDSRKVAAGQFFIALRGERFDGAAYAAASLDAGAIGVMVPPGTEIGDRPGTVAIEVEDTLLGLQRLGHYVRRQSGADVVAITGSAGKTSTKEATAAFLAARYAVYRNAGNLNNHIGLPLSLLELTARPDVAVVELGMNHAGEIRRLVEIAEPDVRVWTNVGDAHIGFFASADAIADAKAEILDEAGPATRAVVNADDPRVMARLEGFPGQVITFGLGGDAEVRATRVEDRGLAGTTASLESPGGSATLTVPIPGRGPLMNVLAATAVALDFNVPLDDIVARAASLAAAPRRGEVSHLGRGVTLVDDSYNSSPAALAIALDALATERPAGRRIAVLGEMRELGDFTDALHRESGRRAAAAHVEVLIAVGGSPARVLADAAVEAGMTAGLVRYFEASDAAAPAVVDLLKAGDVVLVKGSRGTRTDIVADAIKAGWA
jgi:UDP-N-acetylmuramoyl-tripeptide--D-alanyl-D-alanine ligase